MVKELSVNVENARQAANTKVYSTIKKITKKSSTTRMQTVKNKKGEVLTEMQAVKERWKENC